MFTGIIEETGVVHGLEDLGGGISITIQATVANALNVDDSIAIDGVCLTVVDKTDSKFTVQVVEETLRKTTIGRLKIGSVVNLERAMIFGGRLDGHLVQGHVDTTGVIESIVEEQTGRLVTISFPDAYSDFIIGRGSIAVDGISLTVANEEANRFLVAIIPYTWNHTTFLKRAVGDSVNLEFDMVGKYVLRHIKNRES